VVGLAEDEAVPEHALTVDEVNRLYRVGEREKHQKTPGRSQAVVDGLDVCFYPILDRLDAPRVSARRESWIEGERLAFGFIESPRGHAEISNGAEHETFIYILSGKAQAETGGETRAVSEGDIIHAPRAGTYRLQVESPFARFALVRSTTYLEQRIDNMTPEEAEQARISMKPN
jgi:hypothetical protein